MEYWWEIHRVLIVIFGLSYWHQLKSSIYYLQQSNIALENHPLIDILPWKTPLTRLKILSYIKSWWFNAKSWNSSVIHKAFTQKMGQFASGKVLHSAWVQMAHLVLCFSYMFDGDGDGLFLQQTAKSSEGIIYKNEDTMMGSVNRYLQRGYNHLFHNHCFNNGTVTSRIKWWTIKTTTKCHFTSWNWRRSVEIIKDRCKTLVDPWVTFPRRFPGFYYGNVTESQPKLRKTTGSERTTPTWTSSGKKRKSS